MSDLAALRQEARTRGFYTRPTARILGELALHLAASLVGIALCAAVFECRRRRAQSGNEAERSPVSEAWDLPSQFWGLFV